jgi:hypothetical protein
MNSDQAGGALEAARVFPQAVHDSLGALRQIAKAARSKDDPHLRKATPDELALAEQLRQPWHCTGHSTRTGLPCTTAKLSGLEVCLKHGGAPRHVRRAAARRLAALAPTLIESQAYIASQTENLGAAQKAGADLLDRAGVGAVVQAKIRQSRRDRSAPSVQVVIGFL